MQQFHSSISKLITKIFAKQTNNSASLFLNC
ncbi:hypothetical protein T08_11717 [Trichinella sp. T8]|nr:hypothetical protein T08_11717 [Trichinella sp. T8]